MRLAGRTVVSRIGRDESVCALRRVAPGGPWLILVDANAKMPSIITPATGGCGYVQATQTGQCAVNFALQLQLRILNTFEELLADAPLTGASFPRGRRASGAENVEHQPVQIDSIMASPHVEVRQASVRVLLDFNMESARGPLPDVCRSEAAGKHSSTASSAKGGGLQPRRRSGACPHEDVHGASAVDAADSVCA